MASLVLRFYKIQFRPGGTGSAQDPAREPYDALPDLRVGWGGDAPPHSPPRLGAFGCGALYDNNYSTN